MNRDGSTCGASFVPFVDALAPELLDLDIRANATAGASPFASIGLVAVSLSLPLLGALALTSGTLAAPAASCAASTFAAATAASLRPAACASARESFESLSE